MARVKGNTLPILSFQVGAGSTVDLGAYVVSFEVADGDGTNVTMGDWAAGNAPKAANITFALDFALAGAYEYFYANRGLTATLIFRADSGTAVGQTNPKITGSVTMPSGLPNFSVSQGTDVQTFDVTVQSDAGFTKALT